MTVQAQTTPPRKEPRHRKPLLPKEFFEDKDPAAIATMVRAMGDNELVALARGATRRDGTPVTEIDHGHSAAVSAVGQELLPDGKIKKRRRGGKAAAVTVDDSALVAFITANPGLAVGAITKGVGAGDKAPLVARRIKGLIAAGKVVMTGQRSKARYSVTFEVAAVVPEAAPVVEEEPTPAVGAAEAAE